MLASGRTTILRPRPTPARPIGKRPVSGAAPGWGRLQYAEGL